MTTSKLSRRAYNQLASLIDWPLTVSRDEAANWATFAHGTLPLVTITLGGDENERSRYRSRVITITDMGRVEVAAYEPPPIKMTPAGSYLVRSILDNPAGVSVSWVNSNQAGDSRSSRAKLLEEGSIEVNQDAQQFIVTDEGMKAFLATETGRYWKEQKDDAAAMAAVDEMFDDLLEDADERVSVGSLEYVSRKAAFARSTGYVKYADILDRDVIKLSGEGLLRDELTAREQAYIDRIETNHLGAVSGVEFLMNVRITYSYGEADAEWYVDYSRVKSNSYDRRTAHQRNVDAVHLADILRDAIRVCDVLNEKFPRKSS